MNFRECIISRFGRSCINSNKILDKISTNIKYFKKFKELKNTKRLYDYFVGYLFISLTQIILQDIHSKLNITEFKNANYINKDNITNHNYTNILFLNDLYK